MAESIGILFKDITWDTLSLDIAQLCENEIKGEKYWKYPHVDDEYTLSLYEADSWLHEYEEEEISEIVQKFGKEPSLTLCIELRRTKQQTACEHAEILCLFFLEKYNCLVDDAYENMWTADKIKEGGFLNEYR